MVHVEFTLKRFPATGRLKDNCGLPFSCVLQPFKLTEKLPLDNPDIIPQSSIGRCEECYSYINGYCAFDSSGWVCSLCGLHNNFKANVVRRYSIPAADRYKLSELNSNTVEVLCDDFQSAQGGSIPGSSPGPICLALVDVHASEDFLELVRSSLLAALEALPSTALFGIIQFSNKIGLWDVKGRSPSVRYVPIMDAAPLWLSLEDTLPLEDLLAPVGEYKEAISQALELLKAEGDGESEGQAVERSSAAPGMQAEMGREAQGGRGLGPALQAVLEYLKGLADIEEEEGADVLRTQQALTGHTRLMVFLSDAPDLGMGKMLRETYVPDPPSEPVPSGQTENGPGAVGVTQQAMVIPGHSRVFYEQAAVAAASLGVCVDIFVVSSNLVGLEVMEPVASSTGGALYLYPSLDDAALPQDVYRRLSCPHASHCLLRVRTSPEFKVTRAYGRLYPDHVYDNLYHIISCEPTDTFVLDFDFVHQPGFAAVDALPPTLQIAFQYSVLVPSSSKSEREGAAGGGRRSSPPLVVQRRLRIVTLRLYLAQEPRELYKFSNPDAILTVLLHKIMRAVRAEGPREGRLLLRDWLVVAAAELHKHVHPGMPLEELVNTPVDLTFPDFEALQPLPRLVYALLRSPLLAPTSLLHSDLVTFLSHLWSCLPPSELQTALYPNLSSYVNPDQLALPRHSLSAAALATNQVPIFLLDAYIIVIVYYSAQCPLDIPYPPPQQSLLRKTISGIRQERRITPQLRILKEGSEDTSLFRQLLLDEPDTEGPNAPAQMGLPQFLDHVRQEVAAHLRSELEPKLAPPEPAGPPIHHIAAAVSHPTLPVTS